MSEADRDGTPAMLSGWKEIAAYLGKSVRSVQRWERDLRLPVRRINTPDRGQIIYASRAEIEEWRRRMDRKAVSLDEPDQRSRGEQGGSAASVPPVDGPVPPVQVAVATLPPEPQAGWRGRSVLTVLAVAVAVAGGVLLGRWSVTSVQSLERLEFSGTALVAKGPSGETIWRHDFGEPVGRPDSPHAAPVVVDLDGDGTGELLVPVRFGASIVGPARSDEVVCFSRAGSIRWRSTPAAQLTQNGRSLSGPWVFESIAAPGASGPGRTWIAFSHQTRTPGLVLEVDPSGASRLRFVQDGWTRSLAYWSRSSGGVLAVGGVHDVDGRASVALVSVDGPAAQSPTTEDRRLRCASCPEGTPAEYYVLPASEVAKASGRVFSAVTSLTVTEAGLRVSTDDHQVGLIGSTLEFQMLDYTDEHWAEHRVLEEHQKIDHPVEKCRQRLTPREVRAWEPGEGWTTQRVPAEPMRNGGCP